MPVRLIALSAVAIALLSGCSDTAPATPALAPPGPALPPRPTELRIDGLDACSLVTQAELSGFGGVPGRARQIDDGDFAPARGCLWGDFMARQDDSWGVILTAARGAEPSLAGAERVVTVEGFGAVQGTGGLSNPERDCTLIVDIAAGQALKADFSHDSGDRPMNHDIACQEATRLAATMIRNLRAQRGQ